jgi:hypothetical protein
MTDTQSSTLDTMLATLEPGMVYVHNGAMWRCARMDSVKQYFDGQRNESGLIVSGRRCFRPENLGFHIHSVLGMERGKWFFIQSYFIDLCLEMPSHCPKPLPAATLPKIAELEHAFGIKKLVRAIPPIVYSHRHPLVPPHTRTY